MFLEWWMGNIDLEQGRWGLAVCGPKLAVQFTQFWTLSSEFLIVGQRFSLLWLQLSFETYWWPMSTSVCRPKCFLKNLAWSIVHFLFFLPFQKLFEISFWIREALCLVFLFYLIVVHQFLGVSTESEPILEHVLRFQTRWVVPEIGDPIDLWYSCGSGSSFLTRSPYPDSLKPWLSCFSTCVATWSGLLSVLSTVNFSRYVSPIRGPCRTFTWPTLSAPVIKSTIGALFLPLMSTSRSVTQLRKPLGPQT